MPSQYRSPELAGLSNRAVGRLSRAVSTAGALLSLSVGTAWSQQPALRVEPRVSVTMTATDNLNLKPTAKDAALITTIAPGITVSSRSARAVASLDYSLSGVLYTKSDQGSTHQNALNARLSLEAIENWLFIETRATISQQAISAFGTQTPNNQLVNANRTEVANVSVSPSVRGSIAGVASYQLSANLTETRAKDSVAGDNRDQNLSLRLAGLGGAQRLLNWSLSGSAQRTQPRLGRETLSSSALAGLQVQASPELRFDLSAGGERNDYVSTDRATDATYSARATWAPSLRTTAVADWQRHSYGNTHTLSFEHRMARSVVRLLDTQSVVGGGNVGAAGVRSNYDLLFLQFASIEPDPVKRDTLVNNFLLNNGLSPNALATSGFLTNSPTLTRRQEISMSLEGLRTTVTAVLSRTNNRRLDTQAPANAADDLTQFGNVVQQGLSLNLSHRLTPSSSLGMTASSQRSRSDQAGQATDLKSLTANWSGRLGARSTVQFGARTTHFDGQLQSYRENAVFANLVQQF